MNSTVLEKLSPWLFTLGLFVLWEACCRIFKIDRFILPAPSERSWRWRSTGIRCCAIRS